MNDGMGVEGIEATEGEIHDPAVFLQFIHRHVCPRRRVKSSESLVDLDGYGATIAGSFH